MVLSLNPGDISISLINSLDSVFGVYKLPKTLKDACTCQGAAANPSI